MAGTESKILVPPDFPVALVKAVERLAEQFPKEYTFIFSSGTSGGAHKCYRIPEQALLGQARTSTQALQLGPKHHYLNPLPNYFMGGLACSYRCLVSGAQEYRRRDVALALEELPQITHLSLIPTQLYDLLKKEKIDLQNKTLLLGGAKAAPQLLQRARARGAKLIESYGATEFCSHIALREEESFVCLAPNQVKISPEGALLVSTPFHFEQVYFFLKDGTLKETKTYQKLCTEDHFFATQDRAEILEHNQFRFLGRMDRTIKHLGHLVNLDLLEEEIAEHTSIPFFLTNKDDTRKGDKIILVSESKILLPSHLSLSRWPDEYWIVDSFKYTTTGKICKKATMNQREVKK